MKTRTKKRTIYFIIFLLFKIGLTVRSQENGILLDDRDGKSYKTVKIGNQVWMAENLAFKSNSGCVAYDDDQFNIETYGYLYSWESATNACPEGWHLPYSAEWNILTYFVGGRLSAAQNLKSSWGWKEYRNGMDKFGFSALPGGLYIGRDSSLGAFGGKGWAARWWTATTSGENYADGRGIYYLKDEIQELSMQEKTQGFCVRCVKNNK